MIQRTMFTYQEREDWETPDHLFAVLDAEFHFGLDACANNVNHKCERYFSPREDALRQSWRGHGAVWCNPPYGFHVKRWIRKAWEESRNGTTVVCLIFVRSDTVWWHTFVPDAEVWFVRRRVAFKNGPTSAPFPSVVLVFGPSARRGTFRMLNLAHWRPRRCTPLAERTRHV